MALLVHHQHRQQERGEELSNSWRNHHASTKRHSSAPPQHRSSTPSTTSTGHYASHESASPTPSTAHATSSGPLAAYSGGPLSFPSPALSAADKVVADQGVMFVSRATGRRWLAVNSLRACQFGEVLRAVELGGDPTAAPPSYFAIKELSLTKLRSMEGKIHEDPLREVAALQYLAGGRHPNILTCTEALFDQDNLYIVTPFFSGGEVFDGLMDRGRFGEPEARPIFRQVLDALLYLKSHGVCHRDVSLENLVFAEDSVVKLVDFGLALLVPQNPDGSAMILPPQGGCGKQYYMSPEVLTSTGGFDGFAVDVWACGILLFIMLTGVPPFELALPSRDKRCRIVAVEERLDELLSAWDMPLSPEVTGLIQSCLRIAPGRRPSLEALLSHPWVTA